MANLGLFSARVSTLCQEGCDNDRSLGAVRFSGVTRLPAALVDV